jgi:hypothetical protein
MDAAALLSFCGGNPTGFGRLRFLEALPGRPP